MPCGISGGRRSTFGCSSRGVRACDASRWRPGWVRELDSAGAFYRTIARHTGLREGRQWEEGIQFRGAWSTFSLIRDGRPATEGLHVAFPSPDRQTVDEFHRAAVAARYTSHGEPGERPEYGPGYYAAYVLDPDKTNVESRHLSR